MFWNVFKNISVIAMLIISVYAIFNQFANKTKDDKSTPSQIADLSLLVKGMTCNHCKETAMDAIQTCDGVEKVSIDLESGQTLISGSTINEQEIIESINSVGFSVSKLS